MKQAPEEDLPKVLRQRIKRQRKRLKIVRVTFGLTAVLSVVLLFVANQTQTLAPTSRLIFVAPQGDSLWLVDQHLELAQPNVRREGSFSLVKVDGDNIIKGTRYAGFVRDLSRVDANHVGITTDSRYMSFDISSDDWDRTAFEPIGINDPEASPVIVPFDGQLWVCWVFGSDIMVRPFGRPDVREKSLHKTASRGATLLARVTNEAIWLAILEKRDGDLALVSFSPRVEAAVGDENHPGTERDADNAPDQPETPEPAPATVQTSVQRHFSSDVTSNVERTSFAVLKDGARPVVAFTRRNDTTRANHMLVWTKDAESGLGKWLDASPPAREKPPSGLEIGGFLTLAADSDMLIAIYSEAGQVRTSRTTVGADGGLLWNEPTVLPLDGTTGPTAYIIWVSVLFGVLLIMASQGVWLLLNRERPMDRTLAEIIEHKDNEEPKNKGVELPKLLYANAFARALSLLLDIAMTSPVIILLQGIYGYTWEQAYGFLAIGSVASIDASLLPTLQATAVTLLVLAIYGTVCEMIWGRTFGKAMFRLRVVDTEGEQPAAWRIVVRNFLKVFELIHWLVLLVPMGLMMMSGKQQRLGDLLAGTYVIVDLVPEESPDDIDI
ncbi:MAG: RDD family protein [Planctomycetes bacterium]|nr:RDD family protein [Planctomycetota bacterium]